jgi:MoaA/NifB/PqqE/SkfB family radical SAM enzyme
MQQPRLQFWRRIEGGMYRLDETACRMRCVFCPTSVPLPQDVQPGESTPSRTDAIVTELDEILDATPPDEKVQPTADDLMAFDGFFAILETFRRHGRRLELDTPGLRLADPAFAAAVSRYDVHLTLSCQAASDEVYAAMTGNPRAFTLVRAAIDNLRHTRIPFGVNCVVTAINCGSLFDIARFLLFEMELATFNLLHFYPEQYLLDRKPDAWDLLPSYAELDRQLARIGVLCAASGKRVKVYDVAPCQLRSQVVRNPYLGLDFVHGPQFAADSPTPQYRSPSCDQCVLGDRCAMVSLHYVQRDPHMRFDAERVRRDLAVRERLRPWRW